VENADRPDVDAAAGEGRLGDEDERVERVAVFAERPLDEAVVRRVGHRGEESAVEHHPPGLLVELVLVPRPLRDLDDHQHVLRVHARLSVGVTFHLRRFELAALQRQRHAGTDGSRLS
jgi:hypothetical protein